MNARTVTLLLAGLLAGAACVADQSGLEVRLSTICPPTDDCTFTATCDAQYIGLVQMDVAATDHVWLFIQVDNPLPNNADLASGRVNTNDAHITSFEVSYAGLPLPAASRPAANFRVGAGGSATLSVFPVPPEIGDYIAANALGPAAGDPPVRLTAKVTAKGYYDSGRAFESGEFPITVEVCNGCVGVPACAPGDLLATCPPDSAGQVPLSGGCVTP